MANNNVIRVMSFDPGLTSLGWSILDYNLSTNKIHIPKFGEITGKAAIKNNKTMLGIFEKQHIILHDFESSLIQLMSDNSPHYIAVESAFAHRFVNAYAALILVIQTIRRASHKVFNKDIYLIAPKESKLAICHDGTADKPAIQEAILSHSDIIIKDTKQNPVEKLTQHSSDSIACGYTFVTKYLPTILAQNRADKK